MYIDDISIQNIGTSNTVLKSNNLHTKLNETNYILFQTKQSGHDTNLKVYIKMKKSAK
jgi:hypothetical protein